LSLDKNSIIRFFVVGFALMIIPVVLILFWNHLGCFSQSLEHSVVSNYCLPGNLDKNMEALLPFIMVVGGVLVGYNIKRISDSNVPPPEDLEEEESENEGDNETDQVNYSVNAEQRNEEAG
jgi:hypothetical protein